MIWDPHGFYGICGKHAELFRESIRRMMETLIESRINCEQEPAWTYDVPAFDNLNWQQQLGLLVGISRCVLKGDGAPERWNCNEKAACYAVYRNIQIQLEIQAEFSGLSCSPLCNLTEQLSLDFDLGDPYPLDAHDVDPTPWKSLIELAYQEKCQLDVIEFDAPAEETESLSCWMEMVERLADDVLPDRDFELSEIMLDVAPSLGTAVKAALGIDDLFFVQPAKEPANCDIEPLFLELATLAGVPYLGEESYIPF
jgi:hypothetical protein